MAIIWMDGFDVNGNNIRQQNYDIFNGISTSNSNNGRYDGYSILMDDYPSTEINRFSLGAHKTIPNVTEITAGVAVLRQQPSFPGMMINDTAPMLTFYNESPIYANFIVGCSISGGGYDPVTTGSLPFYANIMGRTGNLISVLIPYFNPIAWNYIELEVITGISTGEARMHLNGKLIASVSGATLSTSTGDININRVGLTPININSSFSSQYDDFYVTDTSQRLGEMHIVTLAPSADTAQKDWTPSTGSDNYSIVASTNYADSQYITADDHDLKDIYELSDVPTYITTNGSEVLATRTIGSGWKLLFGESNVSLVITSGTTEVTGPGIDLHEGYSAMFPIPQILNELNPDTGLEWTITDINNLQIGIKTN